MSVLSVIKNLVSPVTDIIDKAVVDKDLKKQLKHDIELQLAHSLDKELKAQRDIIVAEAQGDSWLQKSWRPITMLSFLVLLFVYWFGFAPDYIVDNPSVIEEVFEIIKIGLGGYVVGRSAEKIMDKYKDIKL